MVRSKQAIRPDGMKRWWAIYGESRRVVWAKTAKDAAEIARVSHWGKPDKILPAPADWRMEARTAAPRLKRLSIRVTAEQLTALHERARKAGAATVAEYVLRKALGRGG